MDVDRVVQKGSALLLPHTDPQRVKINPIVGSAEDRVPFVL